MAASLSRLSWRRISLNLLKENPLFRIEFCKQFTVYRVKDFFGRSGRKLILKSNPAAKGRFVPPLLALFGFFSSSAGNKETENADNIVSPNKSSDLQDAIKEADRLYDNRSVEELHRFLLNYKDSNNADLLWRLARASRELSQLTNDKGKKKQLIYDSLDYAKSALESDEKNFACHKWFAIALSNVGDYEGTKEKIKNAFVIKEHFLKAIDLNPGDPTSRHLLGVWCFTFADMPWYQHKLAAAIFSTPPTSTYQEALSHFEMAESLEANFYCENLKMLGKTQVKLGNKEKAKYWLEKAVNYNCKTADDKQAKKEAEEMIKLL